jgi:hypothetical protein
VPEYINSNFDIGAPEEKKLGIGKRLLFYRPSATALPA